MIGSLVESDVDERKEIKQRLAMASKMIAIEHYNYRSRRNTLEIEIQNNTNLHNFKCHIRITNIISMVPEKQHHKAYKFI